jgi:hypothetical protein
MHRRRRYGLLPPLPKEGGEGPTATLICLLLCGPTFDLACYLEECIA